MELRKTEIEQTIATLLSGQSLLVLGEPGAGKTTLAETVRRHLEAQGYSTAIASYGGSAKETLTAIAHQLDVPTVTDDEKPRQLTAQQLRDALTAELRRTKTLLICDNAQRWSTSLKYWLEDLHKAGGLILLLAYQPQPKDIFVKLPMLTLPPLKDDEVREVMKSEAIANGMQLDPKELASLQQRTGNNPGLAKRIVREAALGISDVQSTEHYQFVDGTPFLVALISLVGIIRFLGLGLGDKALYVLGGILALFGLLVRSALYAANRGRRRL